VNNNKLAYLSFLKKTLS